MLGVLATTKKRKTEKITIWTQSGAICGALQLHDEQMGWGAKKNGACGLTNEYPGGFSLIVAEE